MGKYLLAGAALIALSTSAMAADMPVAPEPIAPFSWTGAYVGAHGGWGFGAIGADALGPDELDDLEGFVIGGQIGYNWQWDSWVLGLEADGSFSDQESDEAAALGIEIENDFMASIRGRLGFAADRFLIYGTGGAAWQGSSIDVAGLVDDDVTYFGWAAGGGIEYAITDNVTFGIEYLHYEFDEEEIDLFPLVFDADADNDVIRGRLNIKFDSIFY